jgi:hypothetical protein
MVASCAAVGIACGGLWVRGKEPLNRDVPEKVTCRELTPNLLFLTIK